MSAVDWSKIDQLGGEDDDFQPDIPGEAMQESFDALYAGTKPQLASMKEWPAEWLDDTAPLGWVEWYINYANGVRTDDDARQIRRWKSFKARHGSQLKKNPTPRRAYALRNWAIDPLKLIDDPEQRKELETSMEEYRRRQEKQWQAKHAAFDRSELEAIAVFLNEKLDAKLPLATATEPELEQHILDFVEEKGGVNAAVLEAGKQGLKGVRSYADIGPTGLPKNMPN